MITRAQIRRQLRQNGGIMNAVPRQGYFLGKIVRGVKKAVGKVGDIAGQVIKSPIGKAALIGLGGAGLMGMGPLGGIGAKIGGSGIGGFFKGMGPKLFGATTSLGRAAGMPAHLGLTGHTSTAGILGKLGLTKGGGSMGLTGLGKLAGGAGLLTYFMSKGKTEEEAKSLAQDVYRGEGMGLDIIQADMQKYRSGDLSASQAYDKGYRFLPQRQYMQAATGGRAGFQDGTPAVDSRMQNTYAENIRQNNLQREINERARTEKEPSMMEPNIGRIDNQLADEYMATMMDPDAMLRMPTGMMPPLGMMPRMSDEFNTDSDLSDEQRLINELGIERYNQLYDKGGRVGLYAGTPEEGIKSLEAGASSIKREGDVYPKDDDITNQMYISDEQGALPKKDGGVLPEDMGKLTITDFESKEDYNRYLRILHQGTQELLEENLPSQEDIKRFIPEDVLEERAQGGRIGYGTGSEGVVKKTYDTLTQRKIKMLQGMKDSGIEISSEQEKWLKQHPLQKAQGGRIGKYGGGVTSAMPRIPTGMPRVNAGGISELDYRASGGFVPVGVKEKADDVPAMLSKNEFVMTADAVKGAGGGNVEKGAQKMYNTMKQLEGRIA